jgi:hypothetical protein
MESSQSKFTVTIDQSAEQVNLPEGSPFPDWKTARKFAGPLPFTFTYNQSEKIVLIVEGVRQNWIPKPIQVVDYRFTFLDSLRLQDVVLANAFEIRNIPYHWKKGRTETWR